MAAKLNVANTKRLLEAFDFRELFIEELGWQNPLSRTPLKFSLAAVDGDATPIAELGGVSALQIESPEIPDAKTRKAIHDKLKTQRAEHILIFVDPDHSRSCWSWVKVENKKPHIRDHFYFKGQPGDGFIAKIANMAVDLSELDDAGRLGLLQASKKVASALDTQRVVKSFYTGYQKAKDSFVDAIQGIDSLPDRKWYASVVLNRLKFVYFLQWNGFLGGGDRRYLQNKRDAFADTFYPEFLRALFFDAFAKPPTERQASTARICGDIPYLNGGLFLPHELEDRYEAISIPSAAFDPILKHFASYSWTFNDVPEDPSEEINPEVLGYIFEKYINQKEFGAYYTPKEITEYLCHQTIERLVLDKMEAAGARPSDSVYDLIGRLSARHLDDLLRNVLPSVSLLDPACGSGAFLSAALKSLMGIYTAAIGRIDAFNDEALNHWRDSELKPHKHTHYWLKKKIITSNLYGVDIMAEAVEIARLRLFMALISESKPTEELEPLPNIDFKIMAGNSLIGLTRVKETMFAKDNPGQARMLDIKNPYDVLVESRNALTLRYERQSPDEDFTELKRQISDLDHAASKQLNEIVLANFRELGVKFEEATWDFHEHTEGKSRSRPASLKDIEALNPFHWGYAFNLRFQEGVNGFDAIITNPPWEVLQSSEKEFIQQRFDPGVSKNKIRVEDWAAQKATYMENDKIRGEWLEYLSSFPHQSAYFKRAEEYQCLRVTAKGKKVATKINLYYLFLERCHRLLRPGGLCGIVLHGGIYSDLGAKRLRQMLFEESEITGVFGFENRREIFEGVHRSFKFAVISYRKGGQTNEFPAAFMRVDVSDLRDFPQSLGMPMTVELVKTLSPDAWSLMEFKSELDIQIAEKMIRFPRLGDKVTTSWNLEFRQEFNMTTASRLFRTTPSPSRLPLYEGKMIHHFDVKFAPARYWLEEEAGRKAILGKVSDGDQELTYERYRFAYRRVGRNTDERTLIGTVLPQRVFASESIPVCYNTVDPHDLLSISALFSSFVADWFVRQLVSANVSMHFVYGLPAPRISDSSPHFQAIVRRSARLTCTTPEFSDLWGGVFQGPSAIDPPAGLPRTWTPECGATLPRERAACRSGIDALIAHLYGLSEEEFQHILSAFPLVAPGIKQDAMNAYRDVARGALS